MARKLIVVHQNQITSANFLVAHLSCRIALLISWIDHNGLGSYRYVGSARGNSSVDGKCFPSPRFWPRKTGVILVG